MTDKNNLTYSVNTLLDSAEFKDFTHGMLKHNEGITFIDHELGYTLRGSEYNEAKVHEIYIRNFSKWSHDSLEIVLPSEWHWMIPESQKALGKHVD